jgi:hypothetical protein
MITDKEDEELVRFFHRHVPALSFTFEKGQDVQTLVVTTFILSISGHWFLITAGHCIREIEAMTHKYGYQLKRCQLIDSLGLGAKHLEPIPFAYKNSFPTCLSDDFAFDYGVMILSPYYKPLLKANNMQALDEEVWKLQPSNIDFYMLLGIPGELVKVDSENIEIGSTLHKVERLYEKPEGFTQVNAPLFYGRIVLPEEMTSLKGMSGGPILAFHHNEKGELRYWLIALQSRWLSGSHYIAACPTSLLGRFLEEEIIGYETAAAQSRNEIN